MKTNPFEELHSEIAGVGKLVQSLIDKQQEDIENTFYTRTEAAKILRVSTQTIDNYIESGLVKAYQKDKRSRILIPHSSLFDSLNEVKSLKYKR